MTPVMNVRYILHEYILPFFIGSCGDTGATSARSVTFGKIVITKLDYSIDNYALTL